MVEHHNGQKKLDKLQTKKKCMYNGSLRFGIQLTSSLCMIRKLVKLKFILDLSQYYKINLFYLFYSRLLLLHMLLRELSA